jgi:hypothetical protein
MTAWSLSFKELIPFKMIAMGPLAVVRLKIPLARSGCIDRNPEVLVSASALKTTLPSQRLNV